jgi:hypothetical protein
LWPPRIKRPIQCGASHGTGPTPVLSVPNDVYGDGKAALVRRPQCHRHHALWPIEDRSGKVARWRLCLTWPVRANRGAHIVLPAPHTVGMYASEALPPPPVLARQRFTSP